VPVAEPVVVAVANDEVDVRGVIAAKTVGDGVAEAVGVDLSGLRRVHQRVVGVDRDRAILWL